MNNIFKYKRLIAILLVFTLTFSVVTDYTKKETEAVALVDDILFWTIGLFLLSTGVVAVSTPQVKDMGKSIFDKFIELGGSKNDILVTDSTQTKTLKMTDKLVQAYNWYLKNFPTEKKDSLTAPIVMPDNYYRIPLPNYFSKEIINVGVFDLKTDNASAYLSFGNFYSTTEGAGSVDENNFKSLVTFKQEYTKDGIIKVYIKADNPGSGERYSFYLSYFDSYGTFVDTRISSATSIENVANGFTPAIGIKAVGFDVVKGNYFESIPYDNPIILDNVNEIPLDYENVKDQVLTIPNDTVLDKDISLDNPLTWDDVKDILNGKVDTGTGESTGLLKGLIDFLKGILQSILDAINAIIAFLKSIPAFFIIDWDLVMEHVVYDDIFKYKFKPFYDLTYLLQNISTNPQTHSGKFYMEIPKEMGGDGKEQVVLDLTVGDKYIQLGRAFINAVIWIGFLFYILKQFSPNLSIG